MLAFSTTMRRGADPMLRLQLLAIAEGLMEEIQLKPYGAVHNTAPAGCARDTFNDVRDYNGYSRTGMCTVDGVAIPALAGMQVSTSVATGTLGSLAGALKITVTVQHSGQTLTLVGWRTDYGS
jgi:MSHA pilin protein MshD